MTTLFLCIQNAYVASLSALLVESVCTHLVYGSRQQYQLGCGVSRLEKTTFFGFEFLDFACETSFGNSMASKSPMYRSTY